MTDDKSDKLAVFNPRYISDGLSPEEAMAYLHEKSAAFMNRGYRDSTQFSPEERVAFADYLRRMADHIAPKPATIEAEIVPKELSLPERIKRVYPVVLRAYHAYIGTGQCSEAIVDEKTGARFYSSDNAYGEPDHSARSACVNMALMKADDVVYQITIICPDWERVNPSYTQRYINQRRGTGFFRRFHSSGPTTDIHSEIFKIDCKPLPDFVAALTAGGDQTELRQSVLEHLLSLPEILTPFLDAKEKGQLVKRR